MAQCLKKLSCCAAKEAVGADETPFGGWSVTRLRSAAHGTTNVLGLTLGVGPKGGLGEQGDAVSRQLILTKVSLVERRPENYEVSSRCFNGLSNVVCPLLIYIRIIRVFKFVYSLFIFVANIVDALF